MKPSLRFLGVAVLAWAAGRAAMLGTLPDFETFEVGHARAKVPPIAPTAFAEVPPLESSTRRQPGTEEATAYLQSLIRSLIVPVYYSARFTAPSPPVARSAGFAEGTRFAPGIDLDRWVLPHSAPMSRPPVVSAAVEGRSAPPAPLPPLEPRLDRLQLSSWALMRGQDPGRSDSHSLATGSQLGGSQAGARLIYNLTRQLALTARTSSDVGHPGGEIAAGVRVQPLMSVPAWVTAERRQAIGQYGGRDAFALFVEAGLYQRTLPHQFSADTYVQSGVVGLRSRDWFVDGALAVSRPIYRNVSAGFGIWGGAQPHVSRVDASPRLTMQVRQRMKVHLDWRQKLAGNARPGSGPALTLAGDF